MKHEAGGPSHLNDPIFSNLERGNQNGTAAPDQSELSSSSATHQLARICSVEDDSVMLRMVGDYLEQHNMRAISASGRQEMARLFAAGEPDLVVLDLRLDQEDGLDLLREIRTRSDIPVIITTGDRRDEIDRVVGLELGADDYVTKPFSLRSFWRGSAPSCAGRRPDGPRRHGMRRAVDTVSAAGKSIGGLGGSPTSAGPRFR